MFLSFIGSIGGWITPVPVLSFISKTSASKPIYVWDNIVGHVGSYPAINDATITIAYSTFNFSRISNYINIKYSTNINNITALNTTIFQSSGTSTITGLTSATTYYIQAINDYGKKSNILTVTTTPTVIVIPSGFVEFTTAGTNQTITSSMIPAGVTRVRVHLIGAGGGSTNGGFSSFSAADVSVLAGGGFAGTAYNGSGGGGSVSGVAGVVGTGTGGAGVPHGGVNGNNGGYSLDVGAGIGGGSGAAGYMNICNCPDIINKQNDYYPGGNGASGKQLGSSQNGYTGGAGGAASVNDQIPIYGSLYGAGGNNADTSVIVGGGAGAYAWFYAPVAGATTYANAITVGAGNNAQGGYCRIEWGPGI
jgi:hypothetical protein